MRVNAVRARVVAAKIKDAAHKRLAHHLISHRGVVVACEGGFGVMAGLLARRACVRAPLPLWGRGDGVGLHRCARLLYLPNGFAFDC
jgi:hypothetical protein